MLIFNFFFPKGVTKDMGKQFRRLKKKEKRGKIWAKCFLTGNIYLHLSVSSNRVPPYFPTTDRNLSALAFWEMNPKDQQVSILLSQVGLMALSRALLTWVQTTAFQLITDILVNTDFSYVHMASKILTKAKQRGWSCPMTISGKISPCLIERKREPKWEQME